MANKAKAPARFRKKITCYNCDKEGHCSSDCTQPKNKEKIQKNFEKHASANNTSGAKIETVEECAGHASATLHHHACSTSANSLNWNTDTGATSHMTPHRHWFHTYTSFKTPIKLADNTIVYSEGIGSVIFQPIIGGKPSQGVELTKVLHVPALHNNLLSVLYLTHHKGFNVHISAKIMKFYYHGNVLFTASITGQNVGYLDGKTLVNKMENVHTSCTLPLDLSLWHRRLGHHHYDGIKKINQRQHGKSANTRLKS